MFKLKFLNLALLVGVMPMMAQSGYAAPPQLQTSRLTSSIQISPQIAPEALDILKRQGVRTVIDLRPDGETPDQPSSTVMAQAAQRAGLQFGYVPVPSGAVPPAAAVEALAQLLAQAPQPVLLYCRSGRRAALAWALAEASRPGGLDAASIAQHARDAGQPVDDLRDQIARRIAERGGA